MPEAEWTPDEQGWMVALTELEARECPGCHTDLEETLGTSAEDWIGLPPEQCGKCALIGIQQDAFKETQPRSWRWGAKLRAKFKPKREVEYD